MKLIPKALMYCATLLYLILRAIQPTSRTRSLCLIWTATAKRRKFLLLEKAAASLPLIKTATALSMTEQSFSEQRAVTVLQTLQNMMKTVTAGLTRMTGYSHNLESGRRTKKERMSLFPLRMQGSEQSISQAFQPLSATPIILTIQWLLYKRPVFFSTKTEMQAQYSI